MTPTLAAERAPRRSATGVSNATMALLFFMAAESTVFAGLGASFNILRSQYSRWPPLGNPTLPVAATAVNTALLLLSGLACERAARTRTKADTVRWLGITFLLGGAFLVAQGREWVSLIAFGLTASTVYGGLFYALVGTHAAHVLVSVVVLGFTLLNVQRGRWGLSEVGSFRAWWWFVVMVWPFIYWLVYLR